LQGIFSLFFQAWQGQPSICPLLKVRGRENNVPLHENPEFLSGPDFYGWLDASGPVHDLRAHVEDGAGDAFGGNVSRAPVLAVALGVLHSIV
jgi:hypothetical protein